MKLGVVLIIVLLLLIAAALLRVWALQPARTPRRGMSTEARLAAGVAPVCALIGAVLIAAAWLGQRIYFEPLLCAAAAFCGVGLVGMAVALLLLPPPDPDIGNSRE